MENNGELKKILNTGDVIVVAFGAMIGWGWVVSSGFWIERAGVIGTMLAFLIGGLVIFFVGLAYAELTTAMPNSGGAMTFSHKAFGYVGSFVCTWAVILSYIGVVCFEACSLPTVIQYLFPGFLKGYLYTIAGFDVYLTWLLIAIVLSILIVWVNIIGIKSAAILQKVLTLTIAVVGIILIVISAVKGNSENLNGQMFAGVNAESMIRNIFSVAVITPFFLFGFDVIPQIAGEIDVPLKKVGKLLLLSIGLAVAFYGLVVLAVGYGMNATEVSASSLRRGLVTADVLAKLCNSKTMAKVLILGGVCGIVTSWNSFLIGGSRALMALADAYMIPHVFARTHKKYRTPYLALILIGVLSIVSLFFGRAMLIWISNSASFACCLSYCIVSMAFVRLRKTEPNLLRPYKVKNYKFVGFFAIIMSGFLCIMFLIPHSGCTLHKEELFITGGWAILGLFFALICKIIYKEKFGSTVPSKT